MATDDDVPAGIVVVKSLDDRAEIKRLWVKPGHRGKSIASLLFRRVLSSMDDGVLRLTVWRWREPALALYEKLGFVRVESWERRPELICLERTRRRAGLSATAVAPGELHSVSQPSGYGLPCPATP